MCKLCDKKQVSTLLQYLHVRLNYKFNYNSLIVRLPVRFSVTYFDSTGPQAKTTDKNSVQSVY